MNTCLTSCQYLNRLFDKFVGNFDRVFKNYLYNFKHLNVHGDKRCSDILVGIDFFQTHVQKFVGGLNECTVNIII